MLYAAHATQNLKAVLSDEAILYSPYVSTTSDLAALIRTSFSPSTGGDRNLPQDVFARADSISVFVVPKSRCKDPKSDLSKREGEVCYDSSDAPLERYRVESISNPLKESIEVSATPLAASREEGNAYSQEAVVIDGDMRKLLGKDPVVTPEFIAQYAELYRKREDLCLKLSPLPRKLPILKPPAHEE